MKPKAVFYYKPSAEKLRVKAGKTDGLVCWKRALADFAEGLIGAILGQKRAARGFTCFAGKGPVRQRSLSADLIFWLLFYQEKSNSHPRQLSGASHVREGLKAILDRNNYLP